VLLLLVAVALMPPAIRWWWRRAERSEIGDAVASVDDSACFACHRGPDGAVRWRADGAATSIAGARAALEEGRDLAPGFPGAMPSYAAGRRGAALDRLALGVGVYAGVVAVPGDDELEAGRDIAVEMGCFGCHGVLGAGGTVNPGSAPGFVAGFHGAAFRAVRDEAGGLARIIREGAGADTAWWAPWQHTVLNMPAYGSRLDSTELELLVRYLEWLDDRGRGAGAADPGGAGGGAG
jgi:hypothetical protein